MDLLIERGGWASFTGVLTYKNAETVRAAARRLGWERFLLETDAPFLTPTPHRGKPNEPAYVALTAAFAAEVLNIPLARLAEASTRNACELFGFSLPQR
jgi:TatD DNase family protein